MPAGTSGAACEVRGTRVEIRSSIEEGVWSRASSGEGSPSLPGWTDSGVLYALGERVSWVLVVLDAQQT